MTVTTANIMPSIEECSGEQNLGESHTETVECFCSENHCSWVFVGACKEPLGTLHAPETSWYTLHIFAFSFIS